MEKIENYFASIRGLPEPFVFFQGEKSLSGWTSFSVHSSSDGMILTRKAVKAQRKSKHGGKVMQQGETGGRVPLYKEADERR